MDFAHWRLHFEMDNTCRLSLALPSLYPCFSLLSFPPPPLSDWPLISICLHFNADGAETFSISVSYCLVLVVVVVVHIAAVVVIVVVSPSATAATVVLVVVVVLCMR